MMGGENVMADTQFTILGMSGAGKTCYLLGLYYKMGSGLRGYTIVSDEDTDVQLRDRYARLCDVNLEMDKRFPAGTDNTSQYEFDLQYGYKKIMSFDWLDYPGGLLDRKNSGNLEEYENVKKSINKSSSLFICVDGSLLLGDDTDEKIENVRDNCSNVINTFFSEYNKSNKTLPPTAIIITKYDLCKNDTDADELSEIIEEAFSPFFVKNDIEKFVTIIPVSIGVNIMDEEYSGKMKPINIHLPIFMGIWFANAIQRFKDEIEKVYHPNNEVKLDDLERKREEENKKWWIFKDNEKIDQLTADIEKVKQDKKIGELKIEAMKVIINSMKDNSEKLIKELEKIPYVYVNGRKSSFKEYLGLEE